MQQHTTGTYLIGFDTPVLRTPAPAAALSIGDTFTYRGQRHLALGSDAAGNLHTDGFAIAADIPVLLLTPAVPDTIPADWQVAL